MVIEVTVHCNGHQEDCQAILSPGELSRAPRIFADAVIVIALFVFGGDAPPFSSCRGGEVVLNPHHLSLDLGVLKHAIDVLNKI